MTEFKDVPPKIFQHMEGGRGFIQLKNYYKITIIELQKYLLQKQGRLIQIVTKHKQNKKTVFSFKRS